MSSVIEKLWESSKFTYGNEFIIDSKKLSIEEVFEKLLAFISEERVQKFESVIANRSHSFIPVMEDLHDRGNISAAMRTAESFGFYQFCNIESKHKEKYKYSKRTARGAQKWCSVAEYTSTEKCITDLKSLGYTVLSTHLGEDSVPIQKIDFSKKTALIFGNEKEGVSEEALHLSDQKVVIPMFGFTQSYNISVAAALCFSKVFEDRCRRLGKSGDLTQQEARFLLANYFIVGIQNSKRILKNS